MHQGKIESVREQAKTYFDDVSPSHDWQHVERVYNLAESIAVKEKADVDVVRVAALLHDIGRSREDRGEIENHEIWGAQEAVRILKAQGLDQDLINDVRHCIEAHRFSTEPEPQTLEAKIVSDADNLDALGATGIARTFCYAGESDETLVDPQKIQEERSERGDTSLNHLENRVLKLKNRIYTKTGKEIAEKRHSFVEEYKERFKKELQVSR